MNEQFTFAAADGFRLAVHRGELAQGVSEPVHAIIPARAFSELARLLVDQEQPVEMLLDATKGQVLFRLKDVEVISQLIQGTFPNYAHSYLRAIPHGRPCLFRSFCEQRARRPSSLETVVAL